MKQQIGKVFHLKFFYFFLKIFFIKEFNKIMKQHKNEHKKKVFFKGLCDFEGTIILIILKLKYNF